MEKFGSTDWHQLNNPKTDNLNSASRNEFLTKFAHTVADGLQAGGAKGKAKKAAKAAKAAPAKAKKAAPAKAKKAAPAKAKKAAKKNQ